MAGTTMAESTRAVTLGIDTHGDINVAAAVDERGRLLTVAPFPTTRRGHVALERWAQQLGRIEAIGIEGTGAYGAGVARYLSANGHRVFEVDRPDRRTRRQKGKSDPIDAEAAARAVLAGTATGTPKTRAGAVEMIRVLRVARRSALKARSQAAHQLHCLVSTAPDHLRDPLRRLSLQPLVATCVRLHASTLHDVDTATKAALRSVARRFQTLDAEVSALDQQLTPLVSATAPNPCCPQRGRHRCRRSTARHRRRQP